MDLDALVSALETFGDFRTAGTTPTAARKAMSMNQTTASELCAISRLLRMAVDSTANSTQSAGITKDDLDAAVHEIKRSINAQPTSVRTYAQAANHTTYQSPPNKPQNNEIKSKQIFVSLKDVQKDAPICTMLPAQLTQHCNSILKNFFEQPANGAISMTDPIRAVSKSQAGNLTMTFKDKSEADTARRSASEWAILIDPNATVPQRQYAVVAHNIPTDLWNGDNETHEHAIRLIENFNTDAMAIDYTIIKLNWLNSLEARDRTKRGPLMISFNNRETANTAIDNCLTFNKELCNVSLYVPRTPQCFRCQDWGHRATECAGEARCGVCAGDHETSKHQCTHINPCPTGSRCTVTKPKCANCGGEHASWIRSCPAAKAALAAQTRCEEYRTGRYEESTPFTLADVHATTFTQ
jgi:hypothetical protein